MRLSRSSWSLRCCGDAFAGPRGGPQRAPPRSVADGVYTEEQKTRGQAIYAPNALIATPADLTGGDTAPSLSGYEFVAAWKGTTVDELFEKVRTMPPTSPGKLSPQQSADVLAFILSKNSFRAGATELTGDVAALKSISFGSGQASADASPNRTVRSWTAFTPKSRAGEGRASTPTSAPPATGRR